MSITVLRTPWAFSAAMACAASGLQASAMTMQPAYAPPAATCTTVPAAGAGPAATPSFCISLALPAPTRTPSTAAHTPWPGTSSTSVTRPASAVPPQAAFSEAEMGWFE